MNDENENQLKPISKIRCPLTPYRLFTPVSTVFLDNLTAEEQILGLYKHFNELVDHINAMGQLLNEMEDIIQNFPDQIEELRGLITTLETTINNKLIEISNAYAAADQEILKQAMQYTDDEISKLPDSNTVFNPLQGKVTSTTVAVGDLYSLHRGAALTAEEYDGLELTAEDYDGRGLTAISYDLYGKTLLMGRSIA